MRQESDPSRSQLKMGKLCWLHLSDIHFRPSREWSDATARKALLEHLRQQIDTHQLSIDLIFCTGDIAFGELRSQPLAAQYALAQQFFDELRQACSGADGPLPAERLFVVPGNHDVDRTAIDRAAQETWTRWGEDGNAHRQKAAIEDEFAQARGAARTALNRLHAYSTFVCGHLPHLKPDAASPHLHYARNLKLHGSIIGIGGFNSAWTCAGDEDDRRLWMAAQPQFNELRSGLAEADLRIGLIHHPHDWFNVAERSIIETRQQHDFDFWLHGHTHDLKVRPHHRGATIGTGATTAHDAAEFGYNIVEFDTTTGQGQARLYHYDTNASAWKKLTVPHVAEDGVQPFVLAHLNPAPSPRPTPTPAAPGPTLAAHRLPPDGPCLAREQELARLAALVEASPSRPVWLHGYGGLGKTEIASHYLHSTVARQRFGQRRLFVSVEALEGVAAADLPARLHEHLDSALFGGTLAVGATIADSLHAELVANGPVLLVLDNFETVVNIAPAHAAEVLDSLAPLADVGLALVVTLREPLARPRSRFESIAPQPLPPASARRVLLHWMNRSPGAPLGPRNEAALEKLLTIAEGWPIALQMLGILADIEGLPALARRCSDGPALMSLADELPSHDAHRHLQLSNALTYTAPNLGDAARSLLRALAQFPAGLPEDWLDHWPDAEAVRAVGAHHLLHPAAGALGEIRLKLLTPLRNYLRQTQPLQPADRSLLEAAGHTWWQSHAPELFDDKLQWQSAAAYRDLHRREVGTIAILRGLNAGLPGDAVFRLEHRVGEVDDWPQRCVALRAQVESNTGLFPSRADAEHFAWLLAGSQTLPTAQKETIAHQIAEKQVHESTRDNLRELFTSELDAWSWLFSQSLAERIWDFLADGTVCFQASDKALLAQIRAIDDRDAGILLLHLSRTAQAGQVRSPVRAALDAALHDSPDSPVAALLAAENSSGGDKLAHLRRAVDLAPDWGCAWHDLARALPDDTPDKATAWQATQRCASAHLVRAAQQQIQPDQFVYQALFESQHALGATAAAHDTLEQWEASLNRPYTAQERIKLARAYLQAKRAEDSARHLRLALVKADSGEAHEIRQLAWRITDSAPADAGEVFLEGLYPRFEDSRDLCAAVALLFRLKQIDAAQHLAEFVAKEQLLPPDLACNFGHDLLTRGGDAPASLKLGARLTVEGFDSSPNLARAASLLCAALRVPDAVPPELRRAALAQLLDTNEISPAKIPPAKALLQSTLLLFDARAFGGTDVLNAWLADAPESLRNGPAGQWLAARLTTDQLAAAAPLTSKLDESLEKIAADLAAENAWAAQHADAGAKLAELAERMFSDASEPTKPG